MVRLPLAAATVAAASLPLLPVVAGAQTTGEQEPDQFESGGAWVFIRDDLSCRVQFEVERTDTSLAAGTMVDSTLSPEPDCNQGVITEATAWYINTDDRSTQVQALAQGTLASARATEVSTVTSSQHDVYFEACQCWSSYTLSTK